MQVGMVGLGRAKLLGLKPKGPARGDVALTAISAMPRLRAGSSIKRPF